MNGAVVNVRGKGDKVAVWLADSSLPDSVLRSDVHCDTALARSHPDSRIGRMVKERLGIPEEQTIVYNVHHEDKTRGAANRKKKIVV